MTVGRYPHCYCCDWFVHHSRPVPNNSSGADWWALWAYSMFWFYSLEMIWAIVFVTAVRYLLFPVLPMGNSRWPWSLLFLSLGTFGAGDSNILLPVVILVFILFSIPDGGGIHVTIQVPSAFCGRYFLQFVWAVFLVLFWLLHGTFIYVAVCVITTYLLRSIFR